MFAVICGDKSICSGNEYDVRRIWNKTKLMVMLYEFSIDVKLVEDDKVIEEINCGEPKL